jgi:hypothetical protein
MKIHRSEKNICVESPYNPDLPSQAKKLGGKWNPSEKCWSFDIRDEQRVAEMYVGIYGEWDSADQPAADMVTARVTVCKDGLSVYHGGLFFGGRQVARATGRDSGAKLATGVILLSGDFTSGGSVKNWRTLADGGTVFEIRDIPLSKVDEERHNSDWASVEVLGDIDKAALVAEKERLEARISEINAILAQ